MAISSFDHRLWPIVKVEFIQQTVIEDVVAFFAGLDGLLERHRRFGLIIDVRDSTPPDGPVRKFLSDRIRERVRTLKPLMVMALVVRNALQRGAITAINWLVPPPHPQKVFTDIEAAEAWCRAELGLSEASVPVESVEPLEAPRRSGSGPR
jgi:hypothetical protein